MMVTSSMRFTTRYTHQLHYLSFNHKKRPSGFRSGYKEIDDGGDMVADYRYGGSDGGRNSVVAFRICRHLRRLPPSDKPSPKRRSEPHCPRLFVFFVAAFINSSSIPKSTYHFVGDTEREGEVGGHWFLYICLSEKVDDGRS